MIPHLGPAAGRHRLAEPEAFSRAIPCVCAHCVSEHIINIYSDHEQIPEAIIRKFRIVQTEGERQVERLVDFYSLDMILAIGYRVRNHRGFNSAAGLQKAQGIHGQLRCVNFIFQKLFDYHYIEEEHNCPHKSYYSDDRLWIYLWIMHGALPSPNQNK